MSTASEWRRVRRKVRKGELAGKLERSVFSAEGQNQFYRWLREPVDAGGAFGINQFLAELHYSRMDLRAAFPDLALQDHAEGLVRWAYLHGREVPIPERLLPPIPPSLERKLGTSAVGSPLTAGTVVRRAPSGAGENEAGHALANPWGVNVAGYLRSELGVAEAARLAIRALDAADVPVMPVHGSHVPTSRQQHAFAHVRPEAAVPDQPHLRECRPPTGVRS